MPNLTTIPPGYGKVITATLRALNVGKALKECYRFGEVFRLHSERFGTHDILIVKSPGTGHEDRIRGLEILPNGETRELLHFSSMARDRVEKSWPNLFHYYAEIIGQP